MPPKKPGKRAKEAASPQQEPDPGYRVFISWSGKRSKPAAEAFHRWLAETIPASRPWISSVDIPQLGSSGWRHEILKALQSCKVCVSFLTADNQTAPWLHFEAGAMVQRMGGEQRKLALVLLDLESAQVKEPLVAFQHTPFKREALGRLVQQINDELGESGYSSAVKSAFEMEWPDLEKKMKPAPVSPNDEQPDPDPNAALNEVLLKVRTIEQAVAELSKWRDESTWPQKVTSWSSLLAPRSDSLTSEFMKQLAGNATIGLSTSGSLTDSGQLTTIPVVDEPEIKRKKNASKR